MYLLLHLAYQETDSFPHPQSDARKEALRRNPEYPKYIQNLVSAGYFRGELRGSQRWNQLEDKAAATFVDVRKAE